MPWLLHLDSLLDRNVLVLLEVSPAQLVRRRHRFASRYPAPSPVELCLHPVSGAVFSLSMTDEAGDEAEAMMENKREKGKKKSRRNLCTLPDAAQSMHVYTQAIPNARPGARG